MSQDLQLEYNTTVCMHESLVFDHRHMHALTYKLGYHVKLNFHLPVGGLVRLPVGIRYSSKWPTL